MIDDPGTREALTAMIYGMCLPEKQAGGDVKVHTVIVEGVVAELGGKYWGYQGEPSNGLGWDFGAIEDAALFREEDERYYKNPIEVACGDTNHIKELSKARFVRLKKVTTYEVSIDPGLMVVK